MITDTEFERIETEGLTFDNWKRLIHELQHLRVIVRELQQVKQSCESEIERMEMEAEFNHDRNNRVSVKFMEMEMAMKKCYTCAPTLEGWNSQ